MTMSRYFFLLTFCACASIAQAQVTFAEHIAPIVYEHCSSCHRSGEIGPMPFTNYDEVKSWGNMIQYVTEIEYMPPWQPDPNYSTFLGENYLEQEEIDLISEWVEAGMPRGDISVEPPFPSFPTGSVLGTPDLVLEMAEEYLHKGTNVDDYRYFVLPTGLTEDKVVKAIEFRPGNTQIVHHALIFEDLTGEAAQKDAQTPEYGFPGFGSFNDSGPGGILNQKQFPGYVPGQKPILFPDGVGQVMKAGSDVVMQVHYAPWPVDEYDQSKINIFFADENEKVDREVGNHIMLPLRETIGEVFLIAPGVVEEFHGTYTVPAKVSLIGLFPHMHLLGRHWEVYLEKKDGSKVNLINIPDWDFNWQGGYYFNRYMVAEPGDVVHAIASYDNTTDNPNNPSDPPSWVSWGEKTTDEMYYLPISYVLYKEGDENVIFTEVVTDQEEVLAEEHEMVLRPNPVDDFLRVDFSVKNGETVDITLTDMKGRVMRHLRQQEFFNRGSHSVTLNTTHLPAGMYLVKIQGAETQLIQSFVKK